MSRALVTLVRPALLVSAVVIGAALVSVAMQGDTIADRVLGQIDFVHNGQNLIDARGMLGLEGVAIDSTVTPNRLYVADNGNSRVLGYKDVTTFVDGGAADLVIGQPDFSSGACDQGGNPSANDLCDPIGVAVDDSGNLYVADSDNSRVLEYNAPFAGCGSFPCVVGGANEVFGQVSNFTTSNCDSPSPSASTLCFPVGVAVDLHGNLYIVDEGDNRVLEYNTPLSNTTADLVLGQGGSFTSTTANNGGLSAGSLSSPAAIALDASGDLYVSDGNNNRVLEYSEPVTNGASAELVFGQSGIFTSGAANNGGVSANSMSGPEGLTLDSNGNLYVADYNNNRVLEFNMPLTNSTADTVFGQGGSFSTSGCNQGAASPSSSSL